jgi:transposase
MYYVGLDLHKRQSTFCVLDDNGQRVEQKTVHAPWAKVVQEVSKIKPPFAVCLEAGNGYGYWHEQLAPLADRVVVAHPGHLRLIWRSKRKNDRFDAAKLAKLLYLDAVPAVYVPSPQVRAWRSFIEHRTRLVQERTRIKNALRALVQRHGLATPRALWTQRGLTWLAQAAWPTAFDAAQRDIGLERLATVRAMLRRVTRLLDDEGRRQPGMTLLRTIPGVGPRTAEAVLAYVGRPDRFGRRKAIGAYFGLVPCQDASAAANRLGHITRDGPPTVRRLLVEAAWQGVRKSPTIRRFFERVQGGDPDRKKIAIVATAHYLARVMLAMLQSGEVWQEKPATRRASQE